MPDVEAPPVESAQTPDVPKKIPDDVIAELRALIREEMKIAFSKLVRLHL